MLEGYELCRASVGPGCHQLSLNPLNWRQMCVLGNERLTLYLLEQCDNDQLMLTPQLVIPNNLPITSIADHSHRDTTLPETNSLVGSLIQPPQLSLSASKSGDIEPNHVQMDHPTLPDFTRVLYKEIYDEYTCLRSPVVLTSHCWSSQQTVFVGCRGGQLLTVDFDTGITHVLANAQLTKVYTYMMYIPCQYYMLIDVCFQ